MAGYDTQELKSGGVIKQRQPDAFTVRLRLPGGRLAADCLPTLARVAERWGGGFLHLSVRQTVEIPHVQHANLPEVLTTLAAVGLTPSSCGPRVRVPVACSGCELNPNGLVDTQGLAREIDRRFFGQPTPHKFKVNLAGCPIDCPGARQADLGFLGVSEPVLAPERCTGCGLCVDACDDGAWDDTSEALRWDALRCVRCGECLRVCPLEALEEARRGLEVWAGGKGGKHPRPAAPVARWVREEDVCRVVERALAWYREHARGRERLGTVLEREGTASFRSEVFAGLSGVELLP